MNNSWSAWNRIAFLTDNVASASRLKTSDTFTAWGQTFFANGVPQSVNGVFRELVAGSLNGGVAHSILNNSAAPYGLITRIYGNGMVSLQAQREATTSECFSLTLNPFGGNVGLGTLTPAYKFDVAGDVRSKSMFLRTDITGSAWNNGAGAYNVEITNNSAQTPLMVAYRAGHSPAVTGADRLFAMEFLNIGTLLRFCFGGAEKMSLTNAGLLTPKSLKIGECVISYDETNGALHFSSPLYSDGFITALGAGGVSGGDSSGGAVGVDILQEWGQYNSGTSKQTALSAYLGWELRQSLANCVTLNTAQDIDAYKNFTQGARFLGTGAWFKHANGTEGVYMGCNEDGVLNFFHHSRWAWQKTIGSLDVDGYLTMKAFVKDGGTSSQFLMGDGSVTTKISANAPAATGWTSVAVDGKRIPDMSFLAYWNGAYAGTSSNLKYCWRGLFGTMATETADDYLKRSGGSMTTTGVVANLNADMLDGYHKEDILRVRTHINSAYSLNDVHMTGGIDFRSWDFAHSQYVDNQPYGNRAASAGGVVTFGLAFPFQIFSDYKNTSNLYYRSLYAPNGWQDWRQFAFTDSNVASATKLAKTCYLWGQWFDGNGLNITGTLQDVRNIVPEGHGEWHLGDWSNHFADVAAGEHYSRLDSPLIIRQYKAQPIEFYTNAIKRLTITENGDIVFGGITLRWDAANQCLRVIGAGVLVEEWMTTLKKKEE